MTTSRVWSEIHPKGAYPNLMLKKIETENQFRACFKLTFGRYSALRIDSVNRATRLQSI